MSSDVYFYKIVVPEIEIEDGFFSLETLDYDETGYARADGDVPEWLVREGTLVACRQNNIDMFATGQEMFGEKPVSISTGSYNLNTYCFHFEDGRAEYVDRADLDEYYEEEIFDVYVYGRDLIGIVERGEVVDMLRGYDFQEVETGDIRDVLQRYMSENEGELDDDFAGEYYLRPVYVLAKAMFVAENATVVCEIC